jgi:hypothetical protein
MIKHFAINNVILTFNEIIGLISGMLVPPLEEKSSWVRGSKLVQDSRGSRVSFWLIKMFSFTPGVSSPTSKDTITTDWRPLL